MGFWKDVCKLIGHRIYNAVSSTLHRFRPGPKCGYRTSPWQKEQRRKRSAVAGYRGGPLPSVRPAKPYRGCDKMRNSDIQRQKESHFFSTLPYEIRRIIYGHVFTDILVRLDLFGYQPPTGEMLPEPQEFLHCTQLENLPYGFWECRGRGQLPGLNYFCIYPSDAHSFSHLGPLLACRMMSVIAQPHI